MTHVSGTPGSIVRPVGLLLIALAALASAFALASCASSGTTTATPSAGPTRVVITSVLPKDASAEPPWNGRFVQATVQAPTPATMAAGDWCVYVNGKKQSLERPAAIHPFAADAATVVFVFRDPFGDLGEYRFRVVYAPPSGKKVARSWRYDWAP